MSTTSRAPPLAPPLPPSSSTATEQAALPLGSSSSTTAPPPTAATTHTTSTPAHPSPHHAHFDIPDQPPPTFSPGSASPPTSPTLFSPPATPSSSRKHRKGSSAERKPVVDIEHVPCEDDPREWSEGKKRWVLGLMTLAVVGPLIAPSIYNPVIDELKSDLHATDTQIGLSVSLYILAQGGFPIVWASIAEITGRKPVYLISYGFYTVGSVVCSRAMNPATLIAMRIIQAIGSSAVVAVGAGSLADMYEPHERGRKLGIFYGMPLLGPALGPLIGGALGHAFGWRSAIYFLAAFAGACWILFIFFPDTWRKERSRVYQKAMEGAIKRALTADQKRQRKLARGLSSAATTPAATNPATPHGSQTPADVDVDVDDDVEVAVDTAADAVVVKHKSRSFPRLPWAKKKAVGEDEEHAEIRPTLRDVNPLPTMWAIWKKPHNFIILIASGFMFAAFYTITYTASITLARAPYNYNALQIGLVILAFGVGCSIGSVLGGRLSDRVLRHLKNKNGGVLLPEMRLKSTIPGMPIVIGGFLAYAWTAQYHVHIAGIVVVLFFSGFGIMIMYSSTLSYVVDANPGRSASAVSCNSFIRGALGCVLSQVAIPIQNAIGDGGLFTIVAGLLGMSSAFILLLAYKGDRVREEGFSWKVFRRRRPDLEDGEKASESEDTSSGSAEREMLELPGEGQERASEKTEVTGGR